MLGKFLTHGLKKIINIDFCDFRANFPKTDNFFYHLLREHYEVRLCDQPDFLFFGPYGQAHRLHSGIRVLLSIEPDAPNYSSCDYSISCLKLDDLRHFQLPVYVSYCKNPERALKSQDDPERILRSKTKFCSFIVSNYNPRKNGHRVEFFRALSRYKRVDSAGCALNNMDAPLPGGSDAKVEFLSPYKFNIAFENRSLRGYTTEKIFEPMLARCLPIYWGNPLINEEFNPHSFLNRADFLTEQALIDKIIELDQDDAKYLEFLRQPYFHHDKPNIYFDRRRLIEFFDRIFTTSIMPVGRRSLRKWFFLGRWIPIKRNHWHPLAAQATSPPTKK